MFARGSFRYLAITFAVTIVLTALGVLKGGFWWIGLGAWVVPFGFILWFFRDPERTPADGIVSPADGRVLAIEESPSPRLIIFMAPTSVHVNRSPMDGTVVRTEYRQGGHVPAFKKESQQNERFDLELSTPDGPVTVALIAGAVARRIHPYVAAGNAVKKGDRIGLIAFGSRCELVLPGSGYRWVVRPGQWIKAGATTVARRG
jgi:phosphatidylserine decarboxylase